ncbi:complement C3-like [Clupea harengus]|uniref:Complement C3-like n=1 Tax=Clupea harengus TaxID=7950 RepID=A0A6P8EPF0_CLUHA|nr:complement C3-like [Clupea harengus]
MRLDLQWLACLALCLAVFSTHANADARIKCPETCSPQKTGVRTLAELSKTACIKSTEFVFEVQVENAESSLHTDAYNMTILEVLKNGMDSPQGENRVFISRPSCKQKLDLKTGKTYLIMGNGNSIKKVAGRYHYLFDEQTWVQYWPTDTEGATKQFQTQYNNLEQFRNDMFYGCKSR